MGKYHCVNVNVNVNGKISLCQCQRAGQVGKYHCVNVSHWDEVHLDEVPGFRLFEEEARRLSSSSSSPQKASQGNTLTNSTSASPGQAQISSIASSDQRRAHLSSVGTGFHSDSVQLCQSSISAPVGCNKVPAQSTTSSAALLKSQSRQLTDAKGLQLAL